MHPTPAWRAAVSSTVIQSASEDGPEVRPRSEVELRTEPDEAAVHDLRRLQPRCRGVRARRRVSRTIEDRGAAVQEVVQVHARQETRPAHTKDLGAANIEL